MLSDEQLEQALDEMNTIFGGNLPSPEHEPRRFAHYVKLYRYLRKFYYD